VSVKDDIYESWGRGSILPIERSYLLNVCDAIDHLQHDRCMPHYARLLAAVLQEGLRGLSPELVQDWLTFDSRHP
jgi:hypothetical protein